MRQTRELILMFALILILTTLTSCSDEKNELQDTILTTEEEKQIEEIKLNGLKVAVVYLKSGSIYDFRNKQASKGINQAKYVFGFDLTEKYCNTDKGEIDKTLESVSEDSNLVICVGKSIAKRVTTGGIGHKFPNTEFVTLEWKSRIYKGENAITVMPRGNEVSYMAGMIASKSSKNGKIIGIFSPTDTMVDDIKEGYSMGAKRVNPDIYIISMVLVPENGKESIKKDLLNYFNDDFDVLFINSTSLIEPILDIAKEYGVKIITENGYFYDKAPETVIACMSKGYDALMFEVMRLKAKNKLTSDDIAYVGVRPGFDYIIEKKEGGLLTPELLKTMQSVKMDLANGKIHFDDSSEYEPPIQ